MIQVYCGDQYDVNSWIQINHHNIEIKDIQMSATKGDVQVMVVFELKEKEIKNPIKIYSNINYILLYEDKYGEVQSVYCMLIDDAYKKIEEIFVQTETPHLRFIDLTHKDDLIFQNFQQFKKYFAGE